MRQFRSRDCSILAAAANLLAAGMALLTLVTYLFVYTPLKRRSSLGTVVGAIPGALPPIIGWTAARGALTPEAWTLFGIVFLWQLPHFLAIAWIYREDYARAGFPMLPVIEPDGRSTGRQSVLYAAALVPLSLAPTLMGLAGKTYFSAALVLGLLFFAPDTPLCQYPLDPRRAVRVLWIDHLPAAHLDHDDRGQDLTGGR